MSEPIHTNNGKIPLQSQYVIQALEEEAQTLRRDTVTLRSMLFQCQGEAQAQINAQNQQIADLQRQVEELQQEKSTWLSQPQNAVVKDGRAAAHLAEMS